MQRAPVELYRIFGYVKTQGKAVKGFAWRILQKEISCTDATGSLPAIISGSKY